MATVLDERFIVESPKIVKRYQGILYKIFVLVEITESDTYIISKELKKLSTQSVSTVKTGGFLFINNYFGYFFMYTWEHI